MASKLPKTIINALPTHKSYTELGPEALSELSDTVYRECNTNKDADTLPLIGKWLKKAEKDAVAYGNSVGWTVDRIKRIQSKFSSMLYYVSSGIKLRANNPKGFAFTKDEDYLLNPKAITGISESQIKAMKLSGVFK